MMTGVIEDVLNSTFGTASEESGPILRYSYYSLEKLCQKKEFIGLLTDEPFGETFGPLKRSNMFLSILQGPAIVP